MQQGLAAYRAMGAELQRPSFLALLAEAYGKVGQVEEGLTVLAEALALVDKTGERYQRGRAVSAERASLRYNSGKLKVKSRKSPTPSAQRLAPKPRRRPKPGSCWQRPQQFPVAPTGP